MGSGQTTGIRAGAASCATSATMPSAVASRWRSAIAHRHRRTCVSASRLPAAPAIRAQVALTAAATIVGYAIAVYFICYLVFTPLDADSVWGVQGRYFVPILPLVAIVVAALVNRSPAPWLAAAIAIVAAMLSGLASVAAIIAVDWS